MKEKIALLISAMGDKRTPWYAKAMVVLTLAYIIGPIDLIPDFIPVIGLLDEVILIPVVYTLVMKLVPDEVKAEVLAAAKQEPVHIAIKIFGVCVIMIIWLTLIFVAYTLL